MAICDVLIIGSGVAGLSLAIKLSNEFPGRRIYVVTKDEPLESNTRYAQGGMSVVCDQVYDSFESHIQDTLMAGGGLCNKEVVEKVIRHGPDALVDLILNGVDLDKDVNGDFILGKEGGHSQSRIVHHKDMTGFQIANSLLKKAKALPGIVILSHHTVIDLITSEHLDESLSDSRTCYGAFVLDQKTEMIRKFTACVTVLATGGIGEVYKVSTNPKLATGDGIAIAHRAGATIRNMEFVQFHPTAFNGEDTDLPRFLITEALRGYGAFLRNHEGERFMFRYHSQGELACRDVVARAIESEIKAGNHHCVFLDCTHLPPKQLIRDFPVVYNRCKQNGVDITTDVIPVIPAAHYLCGGIDVDMSARTSITNLYALGECAHTGLHGANRLASNSLLEAVVFSDFCFRSIKESMVSIEIRTDALKADCRHHIENSGGTGLMVMREQVQKLMTKYAGISRTTRGLKYALGYLELMDKILTDFYPYAISAELLELRNIVTTAKLIVSHSLERKTNLGAFYNTDFEEEYVIHTDK